MAYDYQAANVTKGPCREVRNSIKDLFNKIDEPRPQILYHYTPIKHFKLIVGNSSLLGSKIAHLDDSDERRHGQKMVTRMLRERRDRSIGHEQEFFDECFRNVCFGEKWSQDYETSYSISLSGSFNIQKMWDKYGSNCQGVAIGFDTASLEEAATASFQAKERSSITIKPIKMMYVEQEQQELITGCIELAAAKLPSLLEKPYDKIGVLQDISYFTTNALFVAACRFKKSEWKYQEEWRIGPWPWYDEKDLHGVLCKQVEIIDDRPRIRMSLAETSKYFMGIKEIRLGSAFAESGTRQSVENILGNSQKPPPIY